MMPQSAVIAEMQKSLLKTNVTEFKVGDTIQVHTRIIEGEKERIQVFTGTVIARRGKGTPSETFALYRVAYGVGMERVFCLHSPRIAKIDVARRGKTRRSKLYYLIGTFGKKAKIKEEWKAKKQDKLSDQKPALDQNPDALSSG